MAAPRGGRPSPSAALRHVPLGSSTAALHADARAGAGWDPGRDVAPPLSMTTTFVCAPEGGGGGEGRYCYSRMANPTRERAEALLAAVEAAPDQRGGEVQSVLYASGLAAAYAALAALLPARVAISGGYHGTHLVLRQLRRLSGGARFEAVPLPPPGGVAAALQAGDVLWLETPRNPDCRVADVEAYAAAARAVPGGAARVVVDATFAPPPVQRPLTAGADVVMHSSTKYLCGHSDAMGGALCVTDAALAAQLREERTAMGSTPGNLECWLLLRSLRTLHLRVQRQCETATALVAWLHAAVVRCRCIAWR